MAVRVLWKGDSLHKTTFSIRESPQKLYTEVEEMYFDTKNRTVFSPENPTLTHFYRLLEKYAPVIGDSPLFDDLVNAYETLDFDLNDGINEEGGEENE